MKKVFLITAAALLVACGSEQSKAEKAAKKYIAENTNDGKVEIVEYGQLFDYNYKFDPAAFRRAEVEQHTQMANDALDDYRLSKDPIDLSFATRLAATADSLYQLIADVQPIDCPVKVIDVKFRAKNKFGATVTDNAQVFFSPDLEHVSFNPQNVVPDSIYKLSLKY